MIDKNLIYDIPYRRYAIFSDVLHGEQFVVVYGEDIIRAPKWGGFVRWFGGVKEPRKVYEKNMTATRTPKEQTK